MEATPAAASPAESNSYPFRAIILAGLAAGVLDISSAFLIWGLRGVSPIRILQSVASGLLGADSYKGGLASAALGAVCHFTIAFGAAAVYWAACRKLRFLQQHTIVAGVLYGIAVYGFMNFVVVPLSAIGRRPVVLSAMITGLIVHILCVGLPIALIIRWHSRRSMQ